MQDDQAALLAYEADACDFTRLAVGAGRSVKAAMPAGAKLIEAPSTSYTRLTINTNAEPLKDLRVRQAILHTCDGGSVLAGAFDHAAGRSAGVVQPGTRFARKQNRIETRDVEKARALLAEAGAEGLTLNQMALSDSTSQSIAQIIAKIIQTSLGEAGITVNIQPTEDAADWSLGDKTAGDVHKSLELVLMSFAGGVEPTGNLTWFRPEQIGVYNWSFFDSAEFEDLYQKVKVETDDATRKTMFNRMDDLMDLSGGFVFICFTPPIAIHGDRVAPAILADGHPEPVMLRKV